MLHPDEEILHLLERHELNLRRHHRATGGAVDELNADMDALTALLDDEERGSVGRRLRELLGLEDDSQRG